jgi:hypothetical protein
MNLDRDLVTAARWSAAIFVGQFTGTIIKKGVGTFLIRQMCKMATEDYDVKRVRISCQSVG